MASSITPRIVSCSTCRTEPAAWLLSYDESALPGPYVHHVCHMCLACIRTQNRFALTDIIRSMFMRWNRERPMGVQVDPVSLTRWADVTVNIMLSYEWSIMRLTEWGESDASGTRPNAGLVFHTQ